MRATVYFLCALLLLIVAGVLYQMADDEPQGWGSLPVPNEQVSPLPGPGPLPSDLSETHDAAQARSARTGRPLVVLFQADRCEACVYIKEHLLPQIRKRGELGIVDPDRQPSLFDHYWPPVAGQQRYVPYLVVYDRLPQQNDWRFRTHMTGVEAIQTWLGIAAAEANLPTTNACPVTPGPAAPKASAPPPATGAATDNCPPGGCATCPNGACPVTTLPQQAVVPQQWTYPTKKGWLRWGQ